MAGDVRNPDRFCTAHRTNGEPCQNYALRGGFVCRFHGGGAPQVKAANARRLLEELVGPALTELRGLLDRSGVPDHVRLGAVNSILNRTGLQEAKDIHMVDINAIDAEIARLQQEMARIAGDEPVPVE